AVAEIRILAQRTDRKRGDLLAVGEREHELVGAIVERHDAARRGFRGGGVEDEERTHEPAHQELPTGPHPGPKASSSAGLLALRVFAVRAAFPPLDCGS